MPVIEILPIDKLETRATEAFRRITCLDTDLIGEFEPDGFYRLVEKLRGEQHDEFATIRKEVEALGRDWDEFVALLTAKVEMYDSGRDDERECYHSE